MYCAEALCQVGRVAEAAALLEPKPEASSLTLLGCAIPSAWKSLGGCADLMPESRSGLRSLADYCVDVNNAAVLVLQGDLARAEALLEEVYRESNGFLPAVRGLVYILLRRGRSEQILELLRGARYPPL